MAKKLPVLSRVGWSAMEITRLRGQVRTLMRSNRELTLQNKMLTTQIAFAESGRKKVRLNPKGTET